MNSKYKGLSNMGATCYMNSFLQTIYMTPQFREQIYNWQYNKAIDPKQQDSILYQLQKLFGKLQIKYPAQINTKQLIKSFQWEDQQIQVQQDIQEFNRILFQALEKSLINHHQSIHQSNNHHLALINNNIGNHYKDQHFVKNLYEGQMIHYTRCKLCKTQTIKQQVFQQLILPVKNLQQKIYNNSIQLAIQRYMKPQLLDDDNKYQCDNCKKKVIAQRGVKFIKIPKLFCLILRRFNFDYFTFQRVKINDQVTFPFILNMNQYMNGYDHIQNKLDQNSFAYFENLDLNKPQKSNPSTENITIKKQPAYKKIPLKKSTNPNIAGKIITKPSPTTKSFLSQMRKKKKFNLQDNQDLIYAVGNAELKVQTTHENQNTVQPKKQQQTNLSQVIDKSKNEKQKIAQNKDSIPSTPQNTQQQQPLNQTSIILPPILTLTPPQLTQPYKKLHLKQGLTVEQQLADKLRQMHKTDTQSTHSKILQLNRQNQQKIAQYLKEGPLVYQLFSILIHSGSATHGHYYSYINSFQDTKWYCFNDQRVTQIKVQDIQKVYGGTGNSNAYALYYREVQPTNQKIKPTFKIPKYIQDSIKQQIELLKKKQKLYQEQKIYNLNNIITLKIYYQLLVKDLQINKTQTYQSLLHKTRQLFNIQSTIPYSNSRLRLFNPINQLKLQTFQNKQQLSLQQLGIISYKSFLLQIKKQHEIFQPFIKGQITLRITLWEQSPSNIQSLAQQYLTLHKVNIIKTSTISALSNAISQKRKQLLHLSQSQPNPICIIKRHQNDQFSYHEIINVNQNLNKNLDDLMIIQNQILFVQPLSNQLKWPIEFQNQLYRITIKYVNGQTGQITNYLTDSRKPISELKTQLCTFLSLQPTQTILKRGNRSGLQLKNLSLTMKDSRFISGTQIYLQKGFPAQLGQTRILLYLAFDSPADIYNRLHQFEFVADIPINQQWKASQVKQLFVKILLKYKGIQYTPNQFRIRQKVSQKIGKIYRQKPMKQQQLIQKRQIAIQHKPDGIDMKDFKDFSIYIKIWDPQNWTLSQKLQLYVTKNTTMKDLSQLISQQNQSIPIEQMQICRILSINKFKIIDLCQMEYFEITDASVIAQPLFVNSDGLLFVIKSNKKQPRKLTKQQQLKFGGNIKINTKTIKGKQKISNNIKKQKGVVIKVIENKQSNGNLSIQQNLTNHSKQ